MRNVSLETAEIPLHSALTLSGVSVFLTNAVQIITPQVYISTCSSAFDAWRSGVERLRRGGSRSDTYAGAGTGIGVPTAAAH